PFRRFCAALTPRNGLTSMNKPNRELRRSIAISAMLLCIGTDLSLVNAQFAPKQSSVGTPIAILADERINESSGIVRSQLHKDCYWTHNDSGDGPVIFLFDSRGATIARVRVNDADAVDWEDLAILRTPDSPKLIVGDIGNAQPRKHVTLYVLDEPRLDTKTRVANPTREYAKHWNCKLEITIPGGTTNYESLAVDHRDSKILLIEKGVLGGRVYSIPLPANTLSNQVVRSSANLEGRVSVPLATACDISMDGRTMVIISYQIGFLFQRKADDKGNIEAWGDALAREPVSFSLGKLRQTEAVCFSEDEKSVIVTSEFTPTPVVEIKLPSAEKL
ncbi:MAG: hypothetical protein ABL921_31925, partial [Pirellula sp.]